MVPFREKNLDDDIMLTENQVFYLMFEEKKNLLNSFLLFHTKCYDFYYIHLTVHDITEALLHYVTV